MKETERIAEQLRLALEGEAWHGPALLELLDGLDGARAAARPLPGAHSIWEIVLHLTAWARVLRRRLQGDRIYDLAPELDWPAPPAVSADTWRDAREALREEHLALVDAIGSADDRLLEETVPGNSLSYYAMLHGVVQHGLYHAGQISLLRKAAR